MNNVEADKKATERTPCVTIKIKGHKKALKKIRSLKRELKQLNHELEKTKKLCETGKTPVDKKTINRLREHFGRPPLPDCDVEMKGDDPDD